MNSSASTRSCNGCSEDIPAIRLKAKPNARFCISCQSAQDVVISEAPLTSAFAFTKFRTESEPEHNFSAQSARGLLTTGGLSEYNSLHRTDYSQRANPGVAA